MALINCPECNKEISDKAVCCPHCGCPIEKLNEDNSFEQGVINEQEEVLEDKEPIQKRKKNIIIIASLICVIVLGIIIYKNKPLTDNEKHDAIWAVYFSEGYDAAVSKTYEYYGTSDEAVSILMAMDDGSEDDANEIIKQLEITQDMKKDGNYFDYSLTIKNNADTTITYIKYTVSLKDGSGNIVNSDWSNWSGTLKPDAQIVTDSMIDYMDGIETYSVHIDEVKTE